MTRRGTAWLLVLLLAAAAVRAALLLLEWPASNSDEGTMGLMAMHIAAGRGFPSFMDGQSYMGTLEAYAAAATFGVAGPSLLGLRVPMLLAFLVFLAALYVLARRLYGTGVAMVSVGLLALGSREMYGHELVAQGAVPETLVGGTVLLLLGHRLLQAAHDPGPAAGRRWGFAGWGATASLALWSTALTAPFVVTSAVLVVMALRRSGAGVAGRVGAAGGGLLVGAVPWILHDLTHPWRDSSVATLVSLYLEGGTGVFGARSPGLVSQVTNTVTTSLAYVTGGAALAHPSSPPAWPFGYPDGWRPPTDDAVTTLWGLTLVVLWAAAVAAGIRALRRGGTAVPAACTRLAMLGAAGLTVVAFAASPTPGIAPANNARYLVGVLVATPAVLAPLWSLRARSAGAGGFARAAVLLTVAATLALGTVQAFQDAGRGGGEAARRQVIDVLRGAGVTHVYSGYFDCNRLAFLSREQVVCAVLVGDGAGRLGPGFDRYLPYRRAVRDDAGAGFVFRTGDRRNVVLAGSTCRWASRVRVAGYEVWQPDGRCAVAPAPG